MGRFWIIIAGCVLAAAVALAGDLVDQGAPGNQGAWPIKCVSGCSSTISLDGGLSLNIGSVSIDGGYVKTTPLQCSVVRQVTTLIGSSSTNTPSSQQAGRGYIEITNSIENLAIDPSMVVKCTANGGTPVIGRGGLGDTAPLGVTLHYDVLASVTPHCLAFILTDGGTVVDAGVATYECVSP